MRVAVSRSRRLGLGLAVAAFSLAGLSGVFAQAPGHVISIEGMTFKPPTLTVKRGDKVVWQNKDLVPHTATGAGFDSGNIAANASWSRVMTANGQFDYVCKYHPGMKATIVVQ